MPWVTQLDSEYAGTQNDWIQISRGGGESSPEREVAGANEAVSGVLWTMATCPGWGGSWCPGDGAVRPDSWRRVSSVSWGVGQGCRWTVEVPEQGSDRC